MLLFHHAGAASRADPARLSGCLLPFCAHWAGWVGGFFGFLPHAPSFGRARINVCSKAGGMRP